MIHHGGRGPDLLGPAGALRRGLPWRESTRNMIMVCKDYSVRRSKPNPYMPGLGQGHETKKDTPMLMRLPKCNYVSLTKGQELLLKANMLRMFKSL
jgi:hypothetical protein